MAFMRSALLVLGTAIAVVWLPSLLKPKLPVNVGGFTHPEWEEVETVFRQRIESGALRGGSFAVYHEGRPVVHLYGGYADEDALVPWTRDTISIFYSTTKGIGAICIALLVERGFLDYDTPVIKYWPEFGHNGKEHITVKQLLSHQAGLVTFGHQVSLFSIQNDPESLHDAAAKATPIWKLGDGFGYHPTTFAVYVDALVSRVDPKHRNISQFYDDEIRKPLGVDFFIGCPRSEHYRTAKYYELSGGRMLLDLVMDPSMWAFYVPFLTAGKDHPLTKAFLSFKEFGDNTLRVNNPLHREIPFLAAHGYGTAQGKMASRYVNALAKAIAKIWGGIANDGQVDGVKIMKVEMVKKLYEPVISGVDKVVGFNMTFGYGTNIQISPEGNFQAGHPGSGGQMAFMDHKRKLGWAYVSNFQDIKMVTDSYASLTSAMYDAVKNIS